MVMMGVGARLVGCAAVGKIGPRDGAGIREQAHGPIDSRNRNSIVNPDAATIKLFDIGMIVGLSKNARNDTALLGHAHPFGRAKSLDVFLLGDVPASSAHGTSLTSVRHGMYGFPIILTVSGMCPSAQKSSRRRTRAVAAWPAPAE